MTPERLRALLAEVAAGAVTVSEAERRLAWNPVAIGTNYVVKRSTTSGGPYTVQGSNGNPTFGDTVGFMM